MALSREQLVLLGVGVLGAGALVLVGLGSDDEDESEPTDDAGDDGGGSSSSGPTATVYHRERANGVDPRLQDLLDDWEAQGPFDLVVLVDGGVRSAADATRLYAKGRSIPGEPPYTAEHPLGKTVTNAQNNLQTPHGHAAAIDVAPYINRAVPWDRTDLFQQIGDFAKARGFVWGGDFHSLKDLPHIETPDWKYLPLVS